MADRKEGYAAVIASPFGRLGIHAREALTSIDFVSSRIPLQPPRTPLARQVCAQLKAYFADPRTRFDLPLAPDGTPFQQRACRANHIPIIIPCHRVVAANGPGGFMGATRGRAMDIKRWLLEHEAAV
ncbi:MAG TPA: MGMT family protein [Acidiferrobacterales bacterium]|nr:MGMT family protein [Acidiferrobacterales bacterium]